MYMMVLIFALQQSLLKQNSDRTPVLTCGTSSLHRNNLWDLSSSNRLISTLSTLLRHLWLLWPSMPPKQQVMATIPRPHNELHCNTLIGDMTFSKIATLHQQMQLRHQICKDSRTSLFLYILVTYWQYYYHLQLFPSSCEHQTIGASVAVPVSPLPRQHRPVPVTCARHVPAE